jgi:hypothetical protein
MSTYSASRREDAFLPSAQWKAGGLLSGKVPRVLRAAGYGLKF